MIEQHKRWRRIVASCEGVRPCTYEAANEHERPGDVSDLLARNSATSGNGGDVIPAPLAAPKAIPWGPVGAPIDARRGGPEIRC